MGRAMRKHVFGHMRTAKAQISLRIRAVWSGPSLSESRIIEYYWMFQWRANARMRLCACAGWCEYAHFAHARSYLFAWRGPDINMRYVRVAALSVSLITCTYSDKWKKKRNSWRIFKSASASGQSGLSSLSAWRSFSVTSLAIYNAFREDFDLNLRWAHISEDTLSDVGAGI